MRSEQKDSMQSYQNCIESNQQSGGSSTQARASGAEKCASAYISASAINVSPYFSYINHSQKAVRCTNAKEYGREGLVTLAAETHQVIDLLLQPVTQ